MATKDNKEETKTEQSTALPQPPAPPVNTSTDKEGTERIVTLADPDWVPAPTDVVYPIFDEDGVQTNVKEQKAVEPTVETKDDKSTSK